MSSLTVASVDDTTPIKVFLPLPLPEDKKFVAALEFPDDRPAVDSDLEALMQEVKKARRKSTQSKIDYARVLDILIRIRDDPQIQTSKDEDGNWAVRALGSHGRFNACVLIS
ncbi:hypothetical protein D9756_003461 [Leucocoprinus leucothites]|uniref:Uncharacterized protein n=1 Tax=Leucocoprinus leucothites TaxID=201217 RepID=A0A8H5LJ89_9AGAR|nr:hypothetical protein D9756_003461 [Leucoagaricus leucothites]